MDKAAVEAQHPNNQSTIAVLDDWIAEADAMSAEERAQGDDEWREMTSGAK